MTLPLAASSSAVSSTNALISYKKTKPAALPAFQKLNFRKQRQCGSVRAWFCNPSEDPLVKEALKEPVAFMGGMFAGLLRLDLNEDPLREWVTRTVEASSLSTQETTEETDRPTPDDEDAPLQIEIE